MKNATIQWQKYRGWKLRILEELQHSGGMTTREISTRIGYPRPLTSNRLCEMVRGGFVEKVERWGWRITCKGTSLINLNSTKQHNNNITTISQQHNNNITTRYQPDTPTLQLEKEEVAPMCFHATTCHIKQLCKNKEYTPKNMIVCKICVWKKDRE